MFPDDIPPKSARDKKRKKHEIAEAVLVIASIFGVTYLWIVVAAAVRGVL